MAEWGAFIKSSDGSLLVTPDTPCYELAGEYFPTSRVGNVNTYYVPLGEYPLIFVNAGVGNSAGILAVETASGGWTVSVLANVSCSILVFKLISGTATGYGMAVYGSAGNLLFDTNRNVLNVRNAGNIAEGSSFASTTGVNAVSYTCGPVWPSQTQSERWELIDSYVFVDQQYICSEQFVCEQVYECSQQYVCGFETQFVCGFDFFGNYSCSPQSVYVCGFQTVCEWVTRCGFKTVCEWVWVTNTYYIWARIRRTDWTIRRGTAQINSASVTFAWVVHKSGYYDDVVELVQSVSSTSTSGAGLPPPGYQPPPYFFTDTLQVQGELNRDNTYPYTTDRANQIGQTCLTAVRSDYV